MAPASPSTGRGSRAAPAPSATSPSSRPTVFAAGSPARFRSRWPARRAARAPTAWPSPPPARRSPPPGRPFDRERRGMSIGEGAGFMVLEAEARARARGARVYATLAGHGMTTDAFHVTAPEPEGDGMVRAMRAALAGGGIMPADVQYANAHGTGTPQNDRIEARALARVFGEGGLLVSSSKSMIGHTMAAAGSLEAIATVLALGHDLVPPTANLPTPVPALPFHRVPRTARATRLPCAHSQPL